MELTGKNYENYSTPFIEDIKNDEYWVKNHPEELKLHTISVKELYDKFLWMKDCAELNHRDISKIPVFIEFNHKKYVCNNFSVATTYNTISATNIDELKYYAPDVKPIAGEYWDYRCTSDIDCCGFIKSKEAGQRLMRMVRYILDTDSPLTWLDYRENEPKYIQFKFSTKEFDCGLLKRLVSENDNVITEIILRKCVK